VGLPDVEKVLACCSVIDVIFFSITASGLLKSEGVGTSCPVSIFVQATMSNAPHKNSSRNVIEFIISA